MATFSTLQTGSSKRRSIPVLLLSLSFPFANGIHLQLLHGSHVHGHWSLTGPGWC